MKGLSLLANALRPFQICCAPSNLGIRKWICRLNFAQRPIFKVWGSLTSLKSQTRDHQLKVPPGVLVLRILTSWKHPSTSVVFEPANLGSRGEHVTPRPTRSTKLRLCRDQCSINNWLLFKRDGQHIGTTMVSLVLPAKSVFWLVQPVQNFQRKWKHGS